MQLRDLRHELIPDPDGQEFRGGVFEAFDFVEEVVIEAIDDRIDGAFQIGEIDQPADGGVDRAAHGHLAAERMSVHTAALVPRRYMR